MHKQAEIEGNTVRNRSDRPWVKRAPIKETPVLSHVLMNREGPH